MKNHQNSSKIALITVGTTEFDELLKEIDTSAFVSALTKHGYNKAIIQTGRGNYEIRNLITNDLIKFETFQFHPNLTEIMQNVDLVVGHAGAGTVLEVISLGKALLVVTNPTLQDNHQEELARALIDGNYCEVTDPRHFLDGFERVQERVLQSKCLKPSGVSQQNTFPILKPEIFANAMNDMFVFENEK